MKADERELRKFLVKAKKATYSAGDLAKSIKQKDGSTTMVFEDGDWRYHDNYFGGEPYGGREVVLFKNKPVWMMVYYGLVYSTVTAEDIQKIYKTLQDALSRVLEIVPFRGPAVHDAKNGMIYINHYECMRVDNFSGFEEIYTKDGKQLYKASYAGGYVAQR